MSKNASMTNDLAFQFRQSLGFRRPIDDIKRCVKIGFEALSSGTLDTREDGAELLDRLVEIEHMTNTDAKTLKDIFQILMKSGASQQINGVCQTVPLITSITCNNPITFELLLSCASVDLNVSGYLWTPLMTAIYYRREDMVEALCKRFYEIDFNVRFIIIGAERHTVLTYASEYRPPTIQILIETAVNINLPKYKTSVNNLLFDLGFPKVLIPIIGLYTFF